MVRKRNMQKKTPFVLAGLVQPVTSAINAEFACMEGKAPKPLAISNSAKNRITNAACDMVYLVRMNRCRKG